MKQKAKPRELIKKYWYPHTKWDVRERETELENIKTKAETEREKSYKESEWEKRLEWEREREEKEAGAKKTQEKDGRRELKGLRRRRRQRSADSASRSRPRVPARVWLRFRRCLALPARVPRRRGSSIFLEFFLLCFLFLFFCGFASLHVFYFFWRLLAGPSLLKAFWEKGTIPFVRWVQSQMFVAVAGNLIFHAL